MKRKKQGAALIVVIIVFMFVFTVSTAMLSMVASNYKARVAESNRVKNLYASDSGIDVAYNIIGKTFDAAARYANLKVKKLQSLTKDSTDDETSIYNQDYIDMQNDIKDLEDAINSLEATSKDLDNWNKNHPDEQKTQSGIQSDISQDEALIKEDEKLQEDLCNEEFKRSFKNFIKETTASQVQVVGKNETPPDKLIASIDSHSYVSGVSLDSTGNGNFDVESITFGIKDKNGVSTSPNLNAEISEATNVSENQNQTEGIQSTSNGHQYNVSFTVYGEQYYNITVTSSFYTQEVNGKTTDPRQLQTTYRMLVPNYKDIYFQNSNGELNQYLATKDRALTIFGDMNINNVGALNVTGDIFVQGSADNTSIDRVYGKYFGGISLNNSGGVNFENNVITRGTFNIQNTTTPASIATDIGGNLYARNVYVGKVQGNDSGLAGGPTSLKINKQVIINNDLALNADNATITIGDLYGINDENDNATAESSSSIIVNGNNNSSININNSAYLMGTAHIATVGDYQTAESGAVKGNYIAYSVPLHDTDKFAYYNPLQLLDADQAGKEQHFIEYWSKDGNNADSGGIQWPVKDGKPNVWSIGAIIYETDENITINGQTQKKRVVIPSYYQAELELPNGDIYNKRLEFAQYAYKFGQNADIDDYNKGTVTSSNLLIDTSKIPSTYVLGNQQNKGEYAIFNGDKTKEIKITKSTSSNDGIDTTENDIINIQVGNSGVLHSVIATAGKVSIEPGITIDGCIIAQGDLDIDGDSLTGDGVTINYDPEVIERVQAHNVDTFNAVFGSSIVADTDNSTSSTSDTSGATTNYDLKNFLENKLWKILK
ncbi:hypothetical protein [Clostridium sp.]|uniref:hypothetical protein n=1 Tax=Clostridium sp. TaxID=1506 RepID=UPI002843022B|nr:hypothetical protein [Clostridium sp.]MDR3598287.1 hypothetical protein [Clostridium sp.]